MGRKSSSLSQPAAYAFPWRADELELARRVRTRAGSSGARRPLRILGVIYRLSPVDGGPPEMLRQLGLNYHALGDSLEVVTLDDPKAEYLHNLSFPVHAMGPPSNRYGLSQSLVRWLQENAARFDLIVIHGIWMFPAVAAWKAARSAEVPYAVFTHGALDVFFKRRYPLKHAKKLAYWPLQYTILRQAAAVVFTSEPERLLALASFQPNRWTSLVVPYGTNPPPEQQRAQEAAFASRVPAAAGCRFLLFLSRVHPKKGCDLLIRAFAKIAARHVELHLVVAGPDQVGQQRELQALAAQQGIAERVHWPGMLEGAEKYGAFRMAEAFVLPSHQENFGIVVAESLSCGTPVLISDQVNICGEIVETNTGLVEPDTQAGTERLLMRWLELPAAERAAMADRCRPTFRERFSLRRTAEHIHALGELVSQTQPRLD